MQRLTLALAGAAFVAAAVTPVAPAEPLRPTGPARQAVQPVSAGSDDVQNQVIGRYCLRCHNDATLTGGLTLENFDVARAGQNAELSEKLIRKLQAGIMPPLPARRPERTVVEELVATLVSRVDTAAAAKPSPGGRTFQRLNRAEYERSISDLLLLQIDVDTYLPPDTVSAGFDNIADVQGLSVTVMEGYLSAASEISRLAVGDPDATVVESRYSVPRYASQNDRVEGAPYGTRGGLSIDHVFPADGEYVFTMAFFDAPIAFLYGSTTYHDEQIEVSIDGERVALLDLDRYMDADNENLKTEPSYVRAGPQRVTAAFIRKTEGSPPDLLSPHEWSIADKTIGSAYGVTTLPHLRNLSIAGPYNATGVSASVSRDNIFSCRPTAPDEELTCAESIVTRLASEAYRRPLIERDRGSLMEFYEAGADEGGFEVGITSALEAILASPYFVFRLEECSASAGSGDSSADSLVSDATLASRLSFFLWAAPPDDELIGVGVEGRLSDPAVLARQVDRMLADPHAAALGTRFAAQWLRLQDLEKVHPDALLFPDFHQQLGDAMRRETELFFNYLVQDDRSALELLTADYTFVNERLANHYGIPNVSGAGFRRVSLQGQERRGLLGHGSILTLTSHADRTSAVLRGKWVLGVLLGTPPPPPPPDVPDLDATNPVREGRLLTVRERMEEHRANPACASCHRVIDPLGLALENYDVTGAWRTKDNDAPIDATGMLYDGTQLGSPADLQAALLQYSDSILTNFTENLLSYAIGRRLEYSDMPEVRAIVHEAALNGSRMSAFIHGVVNSAAFRHNDRARSTTLVVRGNASDSR